MAYRPSKKVLALFAEVEQIAEQLLALRQEERRLRDVLERVWQCRRQAIATLGDKAHSASEIEMAERVAYDERGKKRPRRRRVAR
jgi:hypothetical protein